GIGILYGKKELLEKMPPYQGGGDMIQSVSFEETTFQEPPLKFEAGTPSIAEVIGLGAAIRFIQKIGFAKIQAFEHELMKYAMTKLSEVPGLVFLSHPKKRSSLISFNCEGCHSLDVGTLLDAKGISVRTGHLCAQPALKRMGVTSTIRVSFGIYNTLEEIDKLVLALKQVVQILR
ncbi:MAG: aminotransferase class V-fold PLP-dependent enzyme, partial [Verrucomicrobia bacterium]|nr:aminotransferase class V-fold PLP-dependent enzyme [Verrucomicrobiota bacterium]